MTPHRDRAPQEVTPVRLEVAARGAAAGALPPSARPTTPPEPLPPPPTAEEIEHDVGVVRRRALATVVYGAGAVAMSATIGLTDGDMWHGLALPALAITAFCGMAAAAGTLWTWLGARRLGDVGISVFDAFDGAWRDVADRAPRLAARGANGTRGALGAAAGAGRAAPRPVAAGGRAVPGVFRVPASAEVLASRWGTPVTRALEDRSAVVHLVEALGPADREMIPDVLPTADLLVRRVGELATTLHELDRDAPPSLVSDVEARLAAARAAAGATPDHDQVRRLELLGRQLDTLRDLTQRREQLTARLESAGLLLQNMRLDLLRLRSAGIESALGELTSVTREAGALSRDIGRALDVAEELRKE